MFLKLAATILAATGALAGFNASAANGISLYWDSKVDIIPIAFVTRVNGQGGAPETNFANANCTIFTGTRLWNCPQIGEDIVTCQKTYGKTILISIGGATYNYGGFPSSQAAIAGAELIWSTFGGRIKSNIKRPFGNARVDGFDLDFESNVNNMPAFARQLRTLMNSDTSKKYYLTATPQCPYPDKAMDPMLSGGIPFDALFIQFYNNYCGTQSYNTSSTSQQNNFNFKTWDDWAKTTSVNKDVRLFLGVPAGPTAAGSGYQNVSNLRAIIDYCKGFTRFGGVAAWDASQAYANQGWLDGVRQALDTRVLRKTPRALKV